MPRDGEVASLETFLPTDDPCSILGQTCNYTEPANAWTYVPGGIPYDAATTWGGGVQNLTLEQAKAQCSGWCLGFTYNSSDQDPSGNVSIQFSEMAGVAPSPAQSSWVFPVKTGLTVVYNNTIFTPWGNLRECGLNLTDWQAQDPVYHDPGTTVATYPDSDTLVAMMRAVLGLPPCNNCTPPAAG